MSSKFGRTISKFDMPFERESIFKGVDEEFQPQVGTTVRWYRFSAYPDQYEDEYYPVTDVHDIYDWGEYRRWQDPFDFPVVGVVRSSEGQPSQSSDEGKSFRDRIRLICSMRTFEKFGMTPEGLSQVYERTLTNDRVEYGNRIFDVDSLFADGFLYDTYDLLVVVVCSQVRPDEMVNDPDFRTFSSSYTSLKYTSTYYEEF